MAPAEICQDPTDNRIIRCIGNCRLLNYIFSHKNNFWCLRKPTRVTPPSYPQGSPWSWWCLNRVNNRIICKVLKICHVGQPFWHCLGRPVLLPLISFLMDIAKNTLWTCAPKGSKADTMYHVVSKLNWHPKDATGLEARQHPLREKKKPTTCLHSSRGFGLHWSDFTLYFSNITFNGQD